MNGKENSFGRDSVLNIQAARDNDRTYLKELSFTAPFKVMTPFIREDGKTEVMVLTASAGIMEGDTQKIKIETLPGAELAVTSQAFEKIHKMKEGSASRRTEIIVRDDSLLSYRPLPVIPFADSAFENQTKICLEGKKSRLIYEEILSCGRAARGERFQYRSYCSRMEVISGEKLIYRENVRFFPEKQPMEEVGMFEGYSHMANLLFFHLDIREEGESRIRDYLKHLEEREGLGAPFLPEVSGGITRTAAGDIAVRVFGNRAQRLEEICGNICTMAM